MNNFDRLLDEKGLSIFTTVFVVDLVCEWIRWVYTFDGEYVGQIDCNTWEWVN